MVRVPYELSEMGVLKCGEFVIGPDGRRDLVILDELGRGAGGSVARAVHGPSGVVVAVKRMAIDDDSRRHQMIDELRAFHGLKDPKAARVHHGLEIGDAATMQHHKFVVDFFDVFVDTATNSLCLVLEFMNAGSLRDFQRRRRQHKEDTTERLLSRVAYCVLSALEYIHSRRELHRDIKPSNILLNSQGHVKVSDYGCHRILDAEDSLATTFTGTLAFMSPERIAGEEYSYPADIWSLGLSLFAAATGENPYAKHRVYWDVAQAVQNSPVPKLPDAKFSGHFRNFVDACLQKDPKKRPSAGDLLRCFPFARAGKRQENLASLLLSRSSLSRPRLVDILSTLHDNGARVDLNHLAAQLGAPTDDLTAIWATFQRPRYLPNSKPSAPCLDTTIRPDDVFRIDLLRNRLPVIHDSSSRRSSLSPGVVVGNPPPPPDHDDDDLCLRLSTDSTLLSTIGSACRRSLTAS